MAKPTVVKKNRVPKWRVQQLVCVHCDRIYLPQNRKQDSCFGCYVTAALAKSKIGTKIVDKPK